MAIKFLDLTGLQKFWTKCKLAFVAKDSSGNVAVTGNLEVDGNLNLKKPINFQNLGATFGDEVELLNGKALVLWDEGTNRYVSLSCNTSNGDIFLNRNGQSSGFLATQSYVETKVANAIAGAKHIKREIVDSLPGVLTKDPNTVYMIRVLADEGGDNDKTDSFEEYMWIQEKWEKVGSSEVDLSGYSTTDQMNTAISTAINNAHTAITETDINGLT